MQLSDEASAATVALITGVDMQRFHVHTRATVRGEDDEVDVKGSHPWLVLFAETVPGEGVNWWYADDDGFLLSADASNLLVCGGRECSVEGCTRAQTLRETEAGYGATPASEALDLLPTPLTEGENQALTEYHRNIETEISNLAYFMERTFREPLKANGAADVLGVCRGLLLELKSRRDEQGMLRDHPTDHPTNRIRYWMERNYPDEREEAQQFSEWVISKLEDGKGIREYREGQMGAIVDTIAALWPEKVPAGGWMGNAATVTIALLEELHGLYRKAQSTSMDRFVYKPTGTALDPTLLELDLDQRGQPGTTRFVCKAHHDYASPTAECALCLGHAEPVWYRYHGSGAPRFMTQDEVEHTSTRTVEPATREERHAYARAQRAVLERYQKAADQGLEHVGMLEDGSELSPTDQAWVNAQDWSDEPAPQGPAEPLDSQIERLAQFIMAEIPGEPSQNDGAIDTAIRIMRDLRQQVELRKEVQQKQLGPIMAAMDRLFGTDVVEVLDGKGWQDIEAVIPAVLERVAERLKRLEAAQAGGDAL